ncbi:MAG: 16S rRNA (cytosine(1402)-N(4))-methyltransferase RsmH [Paludibacteraceae bacterium]|nr:16S rRNA (cytosine(1402)-N(4))-methyltransferase RsmH [Paludibacteraceae bacterium]
MSDEVYHIPALLSETINGLNINPNGIYVDVTFGGGGHSREILKHVGKNGRLYSFDQDLDAQKNAIDDKRFTFVHGNFRFLRNFMHFYGIEAVDGILADLGVSSHHFDDAGRGFSFRFDSPLDMRMNQKAPFTAADILNTYEEQQLASLFRIYGELNDARQLARKIAKARESQKIETTGQLIELAKPKLGKEQEKKYWAKVFQSLRIEVNNEMRALKELLVQANELLKPDGRIAVITYHSLEDRMVKNFFRSGNFDGEAEKDFYGNIISPLEAVNNKVITPSEEEMQQNPRSRSAKLRIARKKQVKG